MRSNFVLRHGEGALRGAWLVVALCCVSGCAAGRVERPRAIIEANELTRRLNHADGPQVVLLDVRELAAYRQGHLAGAVRVDPNTWKNESLAGETGLDHQARWHDRIGSLGVNGRRPVVIYDDGRMTEAARIWFIFQHFDVPEAAVLNGGYPAMTPLISEGRVAVSKDDSAATPLPFLPPERRATRIGLVDRHEVLRAIKSGESRILDVRTREEYTGADRRKNPRGGHLPGAINIPHKQLLDDRGRLKPPEALAAIFEQAGLKRGQRVIAHCESGGRASLAALAAEQAGFGPVLNYYLSFGDWSADATCPLAEAGE